MKNMRGCRELVAIAAAIAVLFVAMVTTLCSSSPRSCQKLDIMLVGDLSGSMIGMESQVADAFNTFISTLDVSQDNIRIGIGTFSDHFTLHTALTGSITQLQGAISLVRGSRGRGTTNMSGAINKAAEQLYFDHRSNISKIIILITDGAPNSADNTRASANQLPAAGIMLCGVFVHGDADDDSSRGSDFLRELCPQCYAHTNYLTLSEELKKLSICL